MSRNERIIRWLIWGVCVVVWTFCLVTPYPIEAGRVVLPPSAHFPTSKLLHVVGYAFLTVLSGWLQVSGWRRWLLLVFLVFHGAATEFIQQWVPERTGNVRDVLLDCAGIFLGFVVSWRWWIRPDPPVSTPS
jgi:VanZ family protein